MTQNNGRSLKIGDRHFDITKMLVAVPTIVLIASSLVLTSFAFKNDPAKIAREIPIQHKGRIKSLDAFSHQTVRLITGKDHWQKKESYRTILDVLADRKSSSSIPWIRVDYRELKSHLGISEDKD